MPAPESAPGASDTTDPALEHERQHLSEARAALHRMRAHTAGLTALGADHVSTEHLKQVLYRRMKALEDDPTVPLFFGRLDYDTSLGGELDETLYIGRRHVTGEIGGEPLVIDWRAQMSLPFYQARPGEPMGVRSRRRFGFSHGQLTAYEDEDLTTVGGVSGLESEILESEIERPRTGPMRDIVATIQPEQDRIVRARLTDSLCIQGAPGTGKTAVGLHRAAYLLYAYRDQLARSGVLVVGPNDSFLSYIGDVLPALGEIDATQATVVLPRHRGHRRRDPRARPGARGVDQGRPADGRGAAPRRLGPRRPPDRRAGGAARGVPVAGRQLPRRGDRRRAHPARCPVRGRPDDVAAAPRPPGAGPDGDRRRLPRRPGAERRRPQQAREDVRGSAVAQGRPGQAGAPVAHRRGLPGHRSGRDPHPGRTTADHDGRSRRAVPPPRAGRWPTSC